jgi:hypothetical protein
MRGHGKKVLAAPIRLGKLSKPGRQCQPRLWRQRLPVNKWVFPAFGRLRRSRTSTLRLLGGMPAKSGVQLVFFYACRRITALAEILLFGPIAHHTGMGDYGFFLPVFLGTVGLSVISNAPARMRHYQRSGRTLVPWPTKQSPDRLTNGG